MPFENEAGRAPEIYGFHKAWERGQGCRLPKGCRHQNAVRAAARNIRCRLPGLAGSQRSLKVWPRRGGGTCQGGESCNVMMNAPPFGGVTSRVTLTSQ